MRGREGSHGMMAAKSVRGRMRREVSENVAQDLPLDRLQRRLGPLQKTPAASALLDPAIAVVAQWLASRVALQGLGVGEPLEIPGLEGQPRGDVAHRFQRTN